MIWNIQVILKDMRMEFEMKGVVSMDITLRSKVKEKKPYE